MATPSKWSVHSILRATAIVACVCATSLVAWGFWWEPASLSVQDHEVFLPGWPASSGRLRIAVLADLHTGSPHNGLEKLSEVVRATNQAEPDLILLAGDFVIHGVVGGQFVEPELSAQVLKGLQAPLGVFAILGNHDWWFDPVRVQAALEQAGIEVLEDRSMSLRFKETRLWLVGVSDYWEGPHNVRKALSGVDEADPIILFTHNPDIFPEIPSAVALTIAGHTHGGQVAVPFIGRPVVPSKFGERYANGHIVEGGRHLFVSSGIGTSILPVRFRVPPEVSVVTVWSSDHEISIRGLVRAFGVKILRAATDQIARARLLVSS